MISSLFEVLVICLKWNLILYCIKCFDVFTTIKVYIISKQFV